MPLNKKSSSTRTRDLIPTGKRPREIIDNHLLVWTPENISFQYQLAGPFCRILAYFLDVFLTQVAYWLFVLVVWIFLGIIIGVTAGTGGDVIFGMMAFVALLGAFVVTWFYGAYMETYYNGRTFGKMVCKQRVLNVDGSAINGTQAVLRNFFRLIDTFPFVSVGVFLGVTPLESIIWPAIPTCIFGFSMMCINKNYRRVGDLVAGTIVVNEEITKPHGIQRFSDPRVVMLAELISSDFVVDKDLALALASYAERRQHLGLERVNEIANRLSPILLAKLKLAPDTNSDLFLCALYYKTFSSSSNLGFEKLQKPEAARQSDNRLILPTIDEIGNGTTPQEIR